MSNTKQLANLVSKVRNLRENVTLWQSIPEHITDAATDSIVVAEYFTQYNLGDMLTPFQVDHLADDLTEVINFIKEANENI